MKQSSKAWSPPGDKSITHRALILASLSEGKLELLNPLISKDTQATIEALQALGVEIKIDEKKITVFGKGLRGLKAPQKIIDCKNSGTTLRLLTGVLAAQNFPSELTGDASLKMRPMQELVDALVSLGAQVECSPHGTAPIRIGALSSRAQQQSSRACLSSRAQRGISLVSPSAQFKSALQLYALCMQNHFEILSSSKTRDHTEKLLSFFGNPPKARDLKVVGDFSSAAFMIALQVLNPGIRFKIENVGLNPTRIGFLDVLQKMGVKFQTQSETKKEFANEPSGSIEIQNVTLKGTEISGELIPRSIDEFPLIALIATQAKGKTSVKDAAWLKTKETNRIQTICESLKLCGAQIHATPDGFEVDGPTPLQGASVSSYQDHRIGMMLCIANTMSLGQIKIDDLECVDVSFPDFLKLIKSSSDLIGGSFETHVS